ncbi:hypothetical protein L596_027331 [Steinernema carpocapsae]|uniref:Ribosome-recycling factor, mitochondrial n=1 Tax=Steinernema carpocapsae TaxID=34508 RepID=A0A4U5M5E0_STECR|nr:hypothetical protein L596_027331 [Steinernema carpocapsae]
MASEADKSWFYLESAETCLTMLRVISRSRSLLSSVNRFQAPQAVPAAQLHLSPWLQKVRRNDKKKKVNVNGALNDAAHTNNEFVKAALKEMSSMEEVLCDELNKHFSLQVDLRVYEEIMVTLESGGEHPLNHLGRISLKNPHLVMVNLADNPAVIKDVRVAIQKSALNVNPQQEGVVMYLPVPRMTRERREQMAATAKSTILNDYKMALNDVYTKYDKKAGKAAKSTDEASKTRAVLLTAKRAMEAKGVALVETKRQNLLSEVA